MKALPVLICSRPKGSCEASCFLCPLCWAAVLRLARSGYVVPATSSTTGHTRQRARAFLLPPSTPRVRTEYALSAVQNYTRKIAVETFGFRVRNLQYVVCLLNFVTMRLHLGIANSSIYACVVGWPGRQGAICQAFGILRFLRRGCRCIPHARL